MNWLFFLFHLAECSRKKVRGVDILAVRGKIDPKKWLTFGKKISFLPIFGVIFWVDFRKNGFQTPVCGIPVSFCLDLSVSERIRSINPKLVKLQPLEVPRCPKSWKKTVPQRPKWEPKIPLFGSKMTQKWPFLKKMSTALTFFLGYLEGSFKKNL